MKNLQIFKYLVFIAVFSEGVNSLFIPTVPSNYFTQDCPAPLVCSLVENCPVQQRVTIGYVQDEKQKYIKCLAEVSSSSSSKDNFVTLKRDVEIVNGKIFKYGVCCSQDSFSGLPPSPVDIETNEVQRVLHRYHRNKRSVNYNDDYNRRRRDSEPIVEKEGLDTVSTDTVMPKDTNIPQFGPIASYASTLSTPVLDSVTEVMNDETTASKSSVEQVKTSGLDLGNLGRSSHDGNEDGDKGSKTPAEQTPPSSSAMLPVDPNAGKNQTQPQQQQQKQQQQTKPTNAPAPYNQRQYPSYPRPPPPPTQINRPYRPVAQAPSPNYNPNRNNVAPAPMINNANNSQPQMNNNNSNPSNQSQMAVPSTQPNVYQPVKSNNYYSGNMNRQMNQNRADPNQSYQPRYSAPRNYQPPQNYYQPPQNNYQPPQNNYQPPQNNYQPPQNNYQPPQNNYQPPQSNYRPTQNNYQPPQSNYQRSRNLGTAPYYQQKPQQQQQQYYEMKPREAPYTQQQSPYASYPENSMNNQNPQAFAFPIVSETREQRPIPGPASSNRMNLPSRSQQPQPQQQQQQNLYKNYQYGSGNIKPLNRQRRRSPSYYYRRRW